MRKEIKLSSLCFVLFAVVILGACMRKASLSETATRTSSFKNKENRDAGVCMLATSSGTVCRLSLRACDQARAALKDIQADKTARSINLLEDTFAQSALAKGIQSSQVCEADLETWSVKSLSLRQRAPVEVASISMRGLQEIKFLIWLGGFAAGMLGDGVGAACMSAVGAGLGYAENKGWIQCKY
jgi:hypothetical protein